MNWAYAVPKSVFSPYGIHWTYSTHKGKRDIFNNTGKATLRNVDIIKHITALIKRGAFYEIIIRRKDMPLWYMTTSVFYHVNWNGWSIMSITIGHETLNQSNIIYDQRLAQPSLD